MDTIFDIGMYDGLDTEYYLQLGHRVVAVEANPMLVRRARQRFSDAIAAGQLVCIHAALSSNEDPVTLTVWGTDLGSSSTCPDRVAEGQAMKRFTVPGTTITALIREYGTPKYLKIDIEGSDRFGVLPLTPEDRPDFLSFEIGGDVQTLLSHAVEIGYEKFKILNQNTFREITNYECLADRIRRRLMWRLGFGAPKMVKRAGRFFVSGHSSGPVPWRSDGRWRSAPETRALLEELELPGWNDLHAATG